jgi:hypothetical protein
VAIGEEERVMGVRLRLALVAVLALIALMGGALPARVAGEAGDNPAVSDVRHVDPERLARLPFAGASVGTSGVDPTGAPANYAVGTTRLFPALNDAIGLYEFRTFILRAIGTSGEVWVAADLQFPLGDCRGLVEITQAQVEYMLGQFDKQIRPTDTGYFGAPKKRDGSKATLPKQVGLPADYYAGSERDIILIDNIRDDNFYTFPQAPTYIAGFFSPAFANALNRNIITVDAFDWQHRTGATPPNEPNNNACRNRQARPFLYEGTFAHEYQHLIHYDYDPAEETWINEGMSDFAEAINGYSFPERPVYEIGYDGHIQSFLGFVANVYNVNGQPVPVATAGAENSLTSWQDQGGNEILADYGIVYAFMLYVDEHYGGAKFMRTWQNSPKRGIGGFEAALAEFGYHTTFAQVYHDFAVAMVVDQLIDGGATGPGADRYGAQALHAQVSLNADQAYGSPGAPPWGSDYVKIADPATIESLSFAGAPNITRPTPWRSRSSGPADWKGGAVIWSGSRNNYDAWMLRDLTLDDGPQTLSFDTYFDIEQCYDYGFVRVSTDGGKTFTSLSSGDTSDCVSKDPDDPTDPRIVAALPGFTGTTPAWTHAEFDLSAYAGQSITLAFYYAQDPGGSGNDDDVANNGWWLDNLMLNDTLLSDGTTSSLANFSDITATKPLPVAFTVQIVGISAKRYAVITLELADGKVGALRPEQLAELAGYDYIVALVTFDAPVDARNVAPIADYGHYALTVTREGKSVVMPGGGK